jgi:fibronectin-binding autotransporter adhesin
MTRMTQIFKQKITKGAKGLGLCFLSVLLLNLLSATAFAQTGRGGNPNPAPAPSPSGGGDTIQPVPVPPGGNGDNTEPGPPDPGGTPPITTLANTEKDVVNGQTNLSASGTYSPSGTPTPTSDVAFTSTTYTSTTFGVSTNSLSMGTLNDLDATQSLIVTNNSTSTNRTITLNGGGDAVSGSASTDLIFLTGSANLTIQDGATNTLGLVLAADGDFDIRSSAALTINSILSGAFNLNKTGAGALTLSGVNTFGAGKTFTLAGGTLNINSAKALGSSTNTFQINGGTTIDNTSGGAVTLTNNQPLTINGDFVMTGAADTTHDLNLGTGAVSLGTSAGTARQITVNSAGTLTIGGVISNGTTANSITKAGSGTLVLNGANLFTGGVTINAGILRAGSTTALGPAGSATLTFGSASTGTFQLNGKNTTVIDLNTNATVGTPVIENANAAASTLTVNTANSDTYAGVIRDGTGGGALSLTKSGGGTLALTGVNTYTGTTTVSSGTLQVSGGSAIADTGLVTLGTVNANTFDVQASETIGALSGGSASIGAVNLASGKTLTLSSGTQTYSGTFSGTGTLKIDGATETIASAVTLGAATLNSGTLTLSSANTITNGLTISGGTLNIGNDNALGTGTLTINGGTLQSTSGTARAVAVTQINVGGDFTIGGGNTGALSFSAPIDLGGATRQITDSNTTNVTTFSGVISNGGLTKLGNGELDLTGTSSNAYTGLTTVSAGTLKLAKNVNLNAFGGDLTINGGSVIYGSNDNQIPDSAKVTISSGSLAFGARTETIGSTGTSGLSVSGTGAITVAGGAVSVGNSATMTGGTITITSSGTFTFNTDFAFSGGTLDSTYTGGSNAGFRLRGGDGTGITYAATGTSTAVISNSGGGAATLNLNNATNATTVFNIADAPTVSKEMSISMPITGGSTNLLQKTGAGVLELSSNGNSYSGGTRIDGGTLLADNTVSTSSATGSGAVTVNSGGTLGGTGFINGGANTITINGGGTLLGGDGSAASGILTLKSAVSMSTSSIISLALGAGGAHSTIAMSSATLTFASNQDFKFVDLGATATTYSGIVTGVSDPGAALNSWVIDNTGWTGSFSWDGSNGGEINLTLTAVPEPSTYAAAALAFAVVCYSQRRRFRRLIARA